MSSGVVGIALIVAIGALMTHSVGWTAAEMSVLEGFSRIHTGILDAAALGIDFLFSPRIAAVLLAGVAVLILLFTRRWRAAVEFVVLVAGSWLGTEVIKYIVQRPRPDSSLLAHPLISETSWSFPSGHTAFAASLALGFIVLARGRSWRLLVVVAGILLAVAVALSRVYLGVHYVSDVTASLLYSAIAVSILAALWNRYIQPLHRSQRRASRDTVDVR
ncbi:MAG: phosphatase PAP2 family protein [Cryobacterium sp.]|nr:phosphatase PAP2 family protein [Cryobacterium sp.]HNP15307.1 phosphatase PAP2 family protein [Terrimesophilobacter sp.]